MIHIDTERVFCAGDQSTSDMFTPITRFEVTHGTSILVIFDHHDCDVCFVFVILLI